nr:MAG TPA: hypothetical protein [Caudoviricetes sp.]
MSFHCFFAYFLELFKSFFGFICNPLKCIQFFYKSKN